MKKTIKILFPIFLIGLLACSFVGKYDSRLDGQVTSIYTTTEIFFLKLNREIDNKKISSPESYKKNYIDFYDKVKCYLSITRHRATVVNKTLINIKHLDAILKIFSNMERKHAKFGLRKNDIIKYRNMLVRRFRGILLFELKKRY